MSERHDEKNVLGGALADCSKDPITGWFRDGCCRTDERDGGVHTVCIEATAEFLTFSASLGNDLSTPAPQFEFPGLKPGDQWCLCAARWLQAYEEGAAPNVRLAATHEKTLEIVPLDALLDHAIDAH
jgi:uncharacterized protein